MLGECHDFRRISGRSPSRHPQDAAVQVDIFPAGQFGVKARADFQQAASTPVIVRYGPSSAW